MNRIGTVSVLGTTGLIALTGCTTAKTGPSEAASTADIDCATV
ncbi:hypothetical protein ACIGGF_19900 [Rhodococcus sp. NPDC078407]